METRYSAKMVLNTLAERVDKKIVAERNKYLLDKEKLPSEYIGMIGGEPNSPSGTPFAGSWDQYYVDSIGNSDGNNYMVSEEFLDTSGEGGANDNRYTNTGGIAGGIANLFSTVKNWAINTIKTTVRNAWDSMVEHTGNTSVRQWMDNQNKKSTRLGRCPVLNPPWQFNELDDVRSNRQFPRVGRMYLENIMHNYPIVCIVPGREKYNRNPLNFLKFDITGSAQKLNNYIRSGGVINFVSRFLIGALNIVTGLIDGVVSLFAGPDHEKFIYFRPSIHLFRNYVNNLLYEVASNLGLVDWDTIGDDLNDIETARNRTLSEMTSDAMGDSINAGSADAAAENTNYNKWQWGSIDLDKYTDGKTDDGDDAADLATGDKGREKSKKDFLDNLMDWDERKKHSETNMRDGTQPAYIENDQDGDNWFTRSNYRGSTRLLDLYEFIPGLSLAKSLRTKNANQGYIPFMIPQGATISETFQNTVGNHPIMDQMNSTSSEKSATAGAGVLTTAMASASSALANADVGGAVGLLMSTLKQGFAGEVIKGAGEMGLVLSGSGKLAIPKIWQDSQFTRSYSFELALKSPIGSPLAVFENTLLPYMIWFCLVNPLQTGKLAYMSPFSIRVYSKGLFSIDFGMVESITVTRGEDTDDRTIYGLPRSIKLSITLADLTPVMMLSCGGGPFFQFRKINTSLTEYVALLTGLSISDRYDFWNGLRGFIGRAVNNFKTNTINFNMLGLRLSNSIFLKPFMVFNADRVSADVVPPRTTY